MEGRVGLDLLDEADADCRCSLMGDPRLIVQDNEKDAKA